MPSPDHQAATDRSVLVPSMWHFTTRWREVTYALAAVALGLSGLGIAALTTAVGGLELLAVGEVALGLITAALAGAVGLGLKQFSRAWTTSPYLVSGLPAVRYQTAEGDYIKFEQYRDGVSANWSTDDGPTVLLSIPLTGKTSHAQFWTSEDESDELTLAELAPNLERHQKEVIRAWVETDRELILWRAKDSNTAGAGQLGVLMRYWNPQRVAELVEASATVPVQRSLADRLQSASSLLTGGELD